MQEAIKEGALRLMTTEAMCDVIINCQGHRLMAHKVILSIASPLLQELLLADQSETSLVVLPDINASIMAYILDYIYTGSVLLHPAVLSEFLSVANVLKLHVEHETLRPIATNVHHNTKSTRTPPIATNFNKYPPNYDQRNELLYQKNVNCEYKNVVNECGPECYKLNAVYPNCNNYKNNIENKPCDYKITGKRLKFTPIILQDERNPNLMNGKRNFYDDNLKISRDSSLFQTTDVVGVDSMVPARSVDLCHDKEVVGGKKKNVRKVPNLMPISRCQFSAFRARRGLYNRVFPSPWCPRIIPVMADPRNDCMKSLVSTTMSNGPLTSNDNLKENSDLQDGHNDKNNNFKQSSYNPLNTQANPHLSENNLTAFRNVEPAALNLNTTYNNANNNINSNINSKISSNNNRLIQDNNYEINLQSADRINIHTIKHYEPANNTITPYKHCSGNDINKSPANKNVINHTSDRQTISAPKRRTPELSYTSNESNSSCGDSKNSEECPKLDRSDEDNGKDDVDVAMESKHKPYKCEDCGKQFSQLRNYKYHRSVHEGTKEFAARCPECGKVFNDRGYLSSHLKIHRDRKEYGCPHCPKRFNQRVAYNMHLRIHTGIKPHVCPTCGKGFSRKMLLKQHQRVHTGERPYQCPECGKSFADRSNMSLHARLHTGVKPYACSLCPKSFTKKHHLKTHMNYHTGLKPYVCQKCGLTFSQSSNMRTHFKKCIQKEAANTSNSLQVT